MKKQINNRKEKQMKEVSQHNKNAKCKNPDNQWQYKGISDERTGKQLQRMHKMKQKNAYLSMP